jgi:hypothetical protein
MIFADPQHQIYLGMLVLSARKVLKMKLGITYKIVARRHHSGRYHVHSTSDNPAFAMVSDGHDIGWFCKKYFCNALDITEVTNGDRFSAKVTRYVYGGSQRHWGALASGS